jgi:hypothetical protein
VDGGQGAVQTGGSAQFAQGTVGLLAHGGAQAAPLFAAELRLAAGVPVAGGDVASAAALLQELLDHPQRNPKTPGHVCASALAIIVGGKDAGTHIERTGGHVAS